MTLFEYGANFQFKDRLGQTPIDEAKMNKRAELLEKLEPLLAKQAEEGGPKRKKNNKLKPRREAVPAHALTAEAAAKKKMQAESDKDTKKPEERQRRESQVLQAERRLSLVKALDGDPEGEEIHAPRQPRRSSVGRRSVASSAAHPSREHKVRLFDPSAPSRPFREIFAELDGENIFGAEEAKEDKVAPGVDGMGMDGSYRSDYSASKMADIADAAVRANDNMAIQRFLDDGGDRYDTLVAGGAQPEEVPTQTSSIWDAESSPLLLMEIAQIDDADAMAAVIFREQAAQMQSQTSTDKKSPGFAGWMRGGA